ncbi:hypothetical protein T439DRAFT_60863 [Meredithblackwellia eburnea MCA 4105]
MNSWAFNQLNQLSPDSSPTNGPGSDERSESSLSFPVSGAELQAQLEAWTNVAFDFDSNDFGAAFDNKDDLVSGHEYYGRLGSTSAHNNNDPLQSLLSLETPTQSGDSPASSLASTASPAADPFAGLYSSASPSTSFHSVVDTSLLPSSFGVPNFPAFAAPSVTAAGATLPQSSIVVPPPTTVAPVTVSAVTAAPAPAPKKAAPKKRRQSTVQAQAPPPPVAETPVPEEAILDDDAANALAVEEDKRRRNTAASGLLNFSSVMTRQERKGHQMLTVFHSQQQLVSA